MRGDDICLYLSADARAALQALAADRNTPRKLVWRAGIVLATADGDSTFEIMFEIMRRARPSKPTVWRWQARYLEEGVSGLKRDKIRRDKTRLSRVPPLPRETRLKVIARTVQDSPPNATHWSRALMAASVGISPSSMGRIRAQAGLKPHLTRGFKVSNDPLLRPLDNWGVPDGPWTLYAFGRFSVGGLLDLFLREAADRIGADDVLTRIDARMEWRLFSPIPKRCSGRSGSGPQGYDPLVLFKCLLIGQWHGLSAPKLERALKLRLDFMLFCGLGLPAPVPDERPIAGFALRW